MLKALLVKLKEAAVSVIPVALLVLILSRTPLVEFSWTETAVFVCASIALVVGISLFNLGADLAMTPMGSKSAPPCPSRASSKPSCSSAF